MTLADILALRPKIGDSVTLRAAIGTAEKIRSDLTVRANELEQTQRDGLLVLEERASHKLTAEAATARLNVAQIEALLPSMRDDLAAATGRETLDELRAEAVPVIAAVDALRKWEHAELAAITAAIGRGLWLQDAAASALTTYEDRVSRAYADQAVRDAGPLDIDIPALPHRLPRSMFAGWGY